jgi:hypothetical protein
MCQTCGCRPCKVCGASIEDGVCSDCGEPSNNCVCDKLEYEDPEEIEDLEEFEEEEDEEEEEEEEDDDH